MSDKVFLLGLGCQKGGTTWLHKQLNKSSSVDLGFVKEYHILDSVLMNHSYWLDLRVNELQKLMGRRGGVNSLRAEKLLKLLSFHVQVENYYQYFDCLWRSKDKVDVVGDITPSYSGLSVNDLKTIRESLERRGFKVKVVFLMRDPFERIYSQLRMTLKREGRLDDISSADVEVELRNAYVQPRYEYRTRYEKVVVNLKSIFPEEDIFFGFYETLFLKKSIDDLCRFLGISPIKCDFSERLNVSSKMGKEISDDLAAEIVEYYRDTYLFCRSEFSNVNLFDLWAGNAFIR